VSRIGAVEAVVLVEPVVAGSTATVVELPSRVRPGGPLHPHADIEHRATATERRMAGEVR
jgi:hypothetical protein